MRCPECNRMASYGFEETPEVENLEIDSDGNISGSVRIVLVHEECGTELKETTFEIEHTVKMYEPSEGGNAPVEEIALRHQIASDGSETDHDLEIDEGQDWEITERVEAKYKGQRPTRYYGYEGTVHVSCSCGAECDVTLKDECKASAMDEMV